MAYGLGLAIDQARVYDIVGGKNARTEWLCVLDGIGGAGNVVGFHAIVGCENARAAWPCVVSDGLGYVV